MTRGIFSKIISFPAILLIQFYKKCISPMFPPVCRFYPSCSTYGLQAFRELPFYKALWLTIWRILRCNPFSAGGYDPVPGTEKGEEEKEHCETCEQT